MIGAAHPAELPVKAAQLFRQQFLAAARTNHHARRHASSRLASYQGDEQYNSLLNICFQEEFVAPRSARGAALPRSPATSRAKRAIADSAVSNCAMALAGANAPDERDDRQGRSSARGVFQCHLFRQQLTSARVLRCPTELGAPQNQRLPTSSATTTNAT